MVVYRVEPIVDVTLWGGNSLNKVRGNGDIKGGTSWEISFHPYGSNLIRESSITLLDKLNEDQQSMIGNLSREKVLRLAYLDAKEWLSIQLHPTIDYVNKNKINDYGKYEAWYIIDAKPGARLVAGTTLADTQELLDCINENRLEEKLIYHYVQKGDFIYIPAGTIHALGKDIFAIEVSTSSNVTYRVYDYGRVDAKGNQRDLHLSHVIKNVNFDLKPQVITLKENKKNTLQIATDNEHFVVNYVDVDSEFILNTQGKACYITILSDSISINEKLDYLENIFVSCNSKELMFKGKGRLLISYSKD